MLRMKDDECVWTFSPFVMIARDDGDFEDVWVGGEFLFYCKTGCVL